jgi:adenylyl-sulfate kinase
MNMQLNHQIKKSKLIWFTGLSGAGKTTLSNALYERFKDNGYLSVVLDGDEIRNTINSDLGFTLEDRTENLRRVAEISRLFLDLNIIIIGAFISPLISDRAMIKKIVGEENYLEIYVNTPIDICEQRDVKGLYKKARNKEISNFTGLSSTYEQPLNPDFKINTADVSVEQCTDQLYQFIFNKIKLPG